jgi:hypothetical protein
LTREATTTSIINDESSTSEIDITIGQIIVSDSSSSPPITSPSPSSSPPWLYISLGIVFFILLLLFQKKYALTPHAPWSLV